VTWPAGFQRRDRTSGEERISEVELTWFTGLSGSDPTVPRRFLAALAQHAPEAMPRRYGGVEPLPYRLEGPNANEDFVARWQDEAATYSPMLFWTAARPCFGGSATMSTEHDPEGRPGRPIVRISASFDGRAFARDPQVTERMIGLFASLAASLSCVYAAGTVQRDMIVKRGRSSVDGRTEATPLPYADRWMGLPAAPTWLAWFGSPYAPLVRAHLAPFIRDEHDGSLLVRLTDDPADRDQLAGLFPPLPLDLIARRRGQPPAWEPDRRYSFLGGPPSQPAEAIPELSTQP
jgi:hypothetical protein